MVLTAGCAPNQQKAATKQTNTLPSGNIAQSANSTTTNRTSSGASGRSPAAAKSVVSSETSASTQPVATKYGWKFVDLRNFGKNAIINGLSLKNGGEIQLTIRHDTMFPNGAMAFSKTFYTATYHPSTNVAVETGTVASHSQKEYSGPIVLNFPMDFPRTFQNQTVSLTDKGVRLAAWPTSILLYGSAANPQTSSPGALDNQIIGQTGNNLWVALKGPQYPPLYPQQGPLLWGFRYWNRLVELNVNTGSAVVYTIPRTYSLYHSESLSTNSLVVPSFLQEGQDVFVSVGSWMGEFPVTPPSSQNSTRITSGNVTQVTSRILIPPPANYVPDQAQEAMNELSTLSQQEAMSLASYWDTVLGATVPGVPPYKDYQDGKQQTWNTDPVIENHGSLPSGLVWAMEFPLSQSDPMFVKRKAIELSILQMLQSSLNADAIGIVPKSSAQVKAQFSGHPPLALPGFQVRNNLYWPAQ